MSNKLKIFIDDQIVWPKRCAKCGKKEDIVTAAAHADTVSSIGLTSVPLLMKVKSQTLELSYPICHKHARLAHISGTVLATRPLHTFIRFLVYVLTMLGTIALLGNWLRRNELPALNMAHWDLITWIVSASFIAFGLIAWSRLWLPIKIARWDEGIADLVFKNADYAKDFAKINSVQTSASLTKRKPWYSPKYWGAIFLGLIASVGFIFLIFSDFIKR